MHHVPWSGACRAFLAIAASARQRCQRGRRITSFEAAWVVAIPHTPLRAAAAPGSSPLPSSRRGGDARSRGRAWQKGSHRLPSHTWWAKLGKWCGHRDHYVCRARSLCLCLSLSFWCVLLLFCLHYPIYVFDLLVRLGIQSITIFASAVAAAPRQYQST